MYKIGYVLSHMVRQNRAKIHTIGLKGYMQSLKAHAKALLLIKSRTQDCSSLQRSLDDISAAEHAF